VSTCGSKSSAQLRGRPGVPLSATAAADAGNSSFVMRKLDPDSTPVDSVRCIIPASDVITCSLLCSRGFYSHRQGPFQSAYIHLNIATQLSQNLLLIVTIIIQEGWLSPTERASISAISLRHILASLGTYAPGTIAVNVT